MSQDYNFTYKLHKLRCPVGGEVLGERKLHEDKLLLCKDCGWKYHWKPHNEKPISVSTRRSDCGCGRCGR